MLDSLRAIARSLAGRNRISSEMDDEMRFHIEQYRQDLIREGSPPEEAAKRARRDFGNLGLTQENCREAKGLPVFDELLRNTVYAFRQLRRSPGFAIAVVLTLGLCIGVNTAVFGVIDAVLLRSLPYPQPDRLFNITREASEGGAFFSSMAQDGAAWEVLKDARTIKVAVMADVAGVNLGSGNRSFYVQQQRVSQRYFSVLGIPLASGREFEPAEDRAGGPDAVVLSYPFWKRFFNADPSLVGRTILLKGAPHVVVGITGEAFTARAEVDIWTPLRPSRKGEGGGTNYEMVGRLNPVVTIAEAQAEVQSLGAGVYDSKKLRLNIRPFEKSAQDALRERLMILWAAAAIVLLIGCVNIAALLLARGACRRREMGTRIALGGGAAALMRQLATESLVLGLLGGLTGLAFGSLALRALQLVTADYGIWQTLALDSRVLAVMAALTIGVSLLFALAPAFQAARVDVRTALVEGGSRAVASSGGSRLFRGALVLAEVALSLMLLVGAGLLIRTLFHLETLNPGFDGTNVITASASLQDARYKDSTQVNRLFRDTLSAIRSTPGAESAAVGLSVPYERWLNLGVRVRAGAGSPDTEIGTSMNYVTPGYLATLRIPFRVGRDFDDRDSENSAPVALVNETFVRKFLAHNDPLGAVLSSGNLSRAGQPPLPIRIVGVVGDLQQQPGLERTGEPMMHEPAVYIPAAQFPSELFELAHVWFSPSWIVRSATGVAPGSIRSAIEQSFARIDPLLPVAHFHSMLDERNQALKSQRTNAWLLGVMATLAVVLALVGVYGIVANSVVERTREFGIRMALGSSLLRVLRDAIAPGVLLAAGGVVLGTLLALATVKVLKGLLFGVQPVDPFTFVATGALLIGVSLVASLLPALSLLRLAPSSVLRQD